MRKLKFTRAENLLFLSPLLLLIVPLIQYFQSDQLERIMARLATKDTIDCGIAHGSTLENNTMIDRDAADACAVSAFEKGRAFRVRFINQISDTANGAEVETLGIVRTQNGEVHFIFYDIQYPFPTNLWRRTLQLSDNVCKATVVNNPRREIRVGKQFVGCRDCENEYARKYGTCYWAGNTD